ncbi:efflux RND transporter permease subunit [Desulfovibrio sp. TomC]|uniref:efflux RND transporter permease subunit n=1 Tax=Desulfovibrio sp. TomC TaxID=1562888 RepID=UPI000573910A|nr:efflux RND transporter permease subunit [Desulfovibrio sp. TomC]KHK03945.1 Cation efflux system protein CusA [Desulfovibrio sp. TomC]
MHIPERPEQPAANSSHGLLDPLLAFCQRQKVVIGLLAALIVIGGLSVAPFDWRLPWLLRTPVAVDAIPNIGENQQIVFSEWPGRSPRDVEEQITYPLTTALLGVSGVKTVRSNSSFGFSEVYVIFEDGVDFYFARTRILEKLASLQPGLLPPAVAPRLGPDATALGQVFWYTLDGLDAQGRFVGGFEPNELRTLQDFYLRYALLAVPGVAEAASIGGFVREYQVDLDPQRLKSYGISLEEVGAAVQKSNLDVGARTLEINRVEYLVRGLGFIKSLDDLGQTLVATRDGRPVFLNQLGTLSFGPALRQGALDKDGHEAVGGVVVTRFGANPMEVIAGIKAAIARVEPGLPKRTLADGTVSQVKVVPFYDRSGLIRETLHTLDESLVSEILVTVVVVLAMVQHLGASLLVSALLPLAVLLTFLAMKAFGVEANIVALAGIAIAIGTMVDMAIILTENILRRRDEAPPEEPLAATVFSATSEVGGAVLASIATTIIGFLPIFFMTGAEGKLFRPLAFTKTFALTASLVVALGFIPPAAELLLRRRNWDRTKYFSPYEIAVYAGAVLAFFLDAVVGLAMAAVGGLYLTRRFVAQKRNALLTRAAIWTAIAAVAVLLTRHWLPLGPERGIVRNLVFVALILGVWLGAFHLFHRRYARMLAWCLEHKRTFLALPATLVLLGGLVWLGFAGLFGWLPEFLRVSPPLAALDRTFPGLQKEFMPSLDEGSFLYMPTTMPHASTAEVLDIVQRQDAALRSLPEVAAVVGKLGRAETPLDPAPINMIETVITYHPEYLTDADGRLLRFLYAPEAVGLAVNRDGLPMPAGDGAGYFVRGVFARDEQGRLIPNDAGQPFRLWRRPLDPDLNPGRTAWPGVRSPEDIWAGIAAAARMPGVTTAPKLQPISARLVMLQSGIRASVAVRVKGPDVPSVEQSAGLIERFLRDVKVIEPASVLSDRITAKPYLEVAIDRGRAGQYGLSVQAVQEALETGVGGRVATTTVEGRERYPVRLRYQRELRDSPEAIGSLLLTTPDGVQVPLAQVADIRYTPGPNMIRGEDAFTVDYVIFDGKAGITPIHAVEAAQTYLDSMRDAGLLELPVGVSYDFTGTFENHSRAEKRLAFILPLAMALIFLVIYLHFASVRTSLIVFSAIPVSWAGGFVMLWLYGLPWFMNLDLFGVNMRQLFQMHELALSLPVWVGFLALFGVATNDGVVMGTYLRDRFRQLAPGDVAAVRAATIEAGLKRVRPCLMTTATTILALIPVLTSRGRGSDLVVPMAIPPFGGMVFVLVTMFVVPVLWCWLEERRLTRVGTD